MVFDLDVFVPKPAVASWFSFTEALNANIVIRHFPE